jgi:hypothetical protein
MVKLASVLDTDSEYACPQVIAPGSLTRRVYLISVASHRLFALCLTRDICGNGPYDC